MKSNLNSLLLNVIPPKFIKISNPFNQYPFTFIYPLFLKIFMYLNNLTQKYLVFFFLNGTIQIINPPLHLQVLIKQMSVLHWIVPYTFWAHTKWHLMPVLTAYIFMFSAHKIINVFIMYVCCSYLIKLINAIKFHMKMLIICFLQDLFLNLLKATLFSLLLAVIHLLTF